ncbi:MAG: hypothetical protein PQJ46_16195 [Spirochaetales bacterium]|nr:hypothetical protein [Spirochaetales bacterium]
MKKITLLLLVALTTLALFSCASSDANITEMTLTGATLVGDPTIDSTNHTITATVKAVDLSTVTPSFSVSEGATAGDVTLTDGTEATCTVTAENGETVDWKITVTVNPGFTFIYGSDSTKILFEEGIISSDEATNTQYGAGLPLASYDTSDDITTSQIFESDFDWDSDEEEPDFFVVIFNGNTTGEVSTLDIEGTVSEVMFMIRSGMTGATCTITSYGNIGEYITGTFSCTEGFNDNDVINISNGFFKVLRLENNVDLL